MADVHVSTWLDYVEEGVTHVGLSTALTTLTENSTIYLDADIDMNNELPNGVTTTSKIGNYTVVLKGQNHKIKNMYSSANGIQIISGYSNSKLLTIQNLNFENVYLNKTSSNPPTLFRYCTVEDCTISATICNSAWGGANFTRCGITIIGSGDSATISRQTYTFCNIEFQGILRDIDFTLVNSYLKGEFTVTSTGNNAFLLTSCYDSVINATITSRAPSVNGTATLLLYNYETWTIPEGQSFPDTMTACSTADLKSSQALVDKNFPAR